jgi:hypothetical protein
MHFAELIGLLAAEPTYNPNETEIKKPHKIVRL